MLLTVRLLRPHGRYRANTVLAMEVSRARALLAAGIAAPVRRSRPERAVPRRPAEEAAR
jgi:hypothetical protein